MQSPIEYLNIPFGKLVVRRYPTFEDIPKVEGIDRIEEIILRKITFGEELTETENYLFEKIIFSKYKTLYTGESLSDLEEEIIELSKGIEPYKDFYNDIIDARDSHGKFSIVSSQSVDDGITVITTCEGGKYDCYTVMCESYEAFFDTYFYVDDFFENNAERVYKKYKKKRDFYTPIDELNDIDELDVICKCDHMNLCLVTNVMGGIKTHYYTVLPDYLFEAGMFSYVKDISKDYPSDAKIYLEIVKQLNELILRMEEKDKPISY